MDKYFDIKLEFDKKLIFKSVHDTLTNKSKGYICVVDGNVLTIANQSIEYKNIVNNAIVNICDGSSIATLAGLIHKKKLQPYTGPELFSNLIEKEYKQYFIGNTPENLMLLKKEFESLNYNVNNFKFMELPFKEVDEFDYVSIAENINSFSPDIIWISLGAPKQEQFIEHLLPYINIGILVAIGAAFNLFLGKDNNKRSPLWMRKLNLEWLFRSILEPDRIGKRAIKYLINIPTLVIEEIKNVKSTTRKKS
jgi:N-acetylglucosaminyldiphosphoundecaprenol N-acetyl-beta-D-mannosaminyltransferase